MDSSSCIPFECIEINKTEIEQSLLNISNKTRTNLFTWNGQFSPQFVEILLKKYTSSEDIVFDPFLGSGTVLYECARINRRAIGIELNPSAYFMSKIFELSNIELSQRIDHTLKIDYILLKFKNSHAIIHSLANCVEEIFDENIKNIISLLIVLCDKEIESNDYSSVEKKWNKLKQTIFNIPYTNKIIQAHFGDARTTKLADNTIDVVITSPPYINVFNYHQNYRKSVELLNFKVLDIAKKELGSNRKNRGNRLLTVIQYCIDMSIVFSELNRISKNKARLIFVVGRESNILGLNFSNSSIIYDIACEVVGLKLILKQERVFKNRFGKLIYEDILHFEKKSFAKSLDTNTIINKAQKIAENYLKQKLSSIDEDNKSYYPLIEAITKVRKVQQSDY